MSKLISAVRNLLNTSKQRLLYYHFYFDLINEQIDIYLYEYTTYFSMMYYRNNPTIICIKILQRISSNIANLEQQRFNRLEYPTQYDYKRFEYSVRFQV